MVCGWGGGGEEGAGGIGGGGGVERSAAYVRTEQSVNLSHILI